jgi:hypothetical protein
MRTSGRVLVVMVVAAASGLVACQGRSPAAPEPASAATTAAHIQGDASVVIARGSLDITSRTEERLNIGSHDPERFSWKGELTEGRNPLELIDVGVPGATVSIAGQWAGVSLSFTTLTWGKTTYSRVGGNNEPTAGQFDVEGTVTLPLYTGQTTARVSTPFALLNTFFMAPDLQLQLSGGGTATVWLSWVPIPLNGLPDGYWRVTRIVYRFDH